MAQQAIAVAQSSKQVGQSKNDRVNAMAAANAGWQAYQTGKGAQNLANGTTNAKQVSISITYGEQQMGLRLKYNGPLKEEFKRLKFHQSDGRQLVSDELKTIVFEKVK